MSNIKLIRNGDGEAIVFSSVLRWLGGIAAVVAAGVTLSAIYAIINLAIVTRDNTRAIDSLTLKIDVLGTTSEKRWDDERLYDAQMQLRFDQLKARVGMLDRRGEIP